VADHLERIRPGRPEPRDWPEDTASIYAELTDEDWRLAEAMLPLVKETWPDDESGGHDVADNVATNP
jgi:hypothetical protein